MVISFTDLKRDPRVNRQVDALRSRRRVIAVGTGDPQLEGVRFVGCTRVPRPLFVKLGEAAESHLQRYEPHYWGMAHVMQLCRKLKDLRVNLVVVNDIEALPVRLRLANGAKVIFDAHEYAPRELEDRWQWRFLFQRYITYLCETYLPRTAAMITVCEGIAKAYETNFGVHPGVVYNAPYLADLKPKPPHGQAVRLIHHGGATASRQIEKMIQMMAYLDARFTFDLYLVPTEPAYLLRLKKLAAADNRILFCPPVPMTELPGVVNQYDMGVYLLQPNSFNNQFSLPNKFFEFVQGRVGIAIGPSPEMARLVRQYDCGMVADDFSPKSLASKLSELTYERVMHYKQRADAASAVLCYEQAAVELLRIVRRVAETQG